MCISVALQVFLVDIKRSCAAQLLLEKYFSSVDLVGLLLVDVGPLRSCAAGLLLENNYN